MGRVAEGQGRGEVLRKTLRPQRNGEGGRGPGSGRAAGGSVTGGRGGLAPREGRVSGGPVLGRGGVQEAVGVSGTEGAVGVDDRADARGRDRPVCAVGARTGRGRRGAWSARRLC